MAVTLNLLITDQLHKDLEEITIAFNAKLQGAVTKTQMCNLLLAACFKFHSDQRLIDFAHLILKPPVKTKKQIARIANVIASNN
jgi:hypothetical protein